ncbi:17073_t:CDS:2 [Entrophospora sp. SA101]|nr:17073_t:CDS:2 [Entrophospora sp. SA101]
MARILTGNVDYEEQLDGESLISLEERKRAYESSEGPLTPQKKISLNLDSDENTIRNIPLENPFFCENEMIDFDFKDLEKQLEHIEESQNDWIVDSINVSKKFKEYQKDLISAVKNKKVKLTWADTYEILAISSIIVLTLPCPYKPTFSTSQWNKIISLNPYKIEQPILSQSVSSSLLEATYYASLNLEHELNLNDKSEIANKCFRIFNNLKSELPIIYENKRTEDEHCFYFLYPIIKPIFCDCTYKNYTLRLNKSTIGTSKRPDFSCLDYVKVHLKAKGTINKMANLQGGPTEALGFLNMGDSAESLLIDLKYDGIYRSFELFKSKLVIEKVSFPLLVPTISHFLLLEEKVKNLVDEYEYFSSNPMPKSTFIREFPYSPQIKSLLKK